jgi:transposase
MLSAEPDYLPPDERDREIFEATVPEDHYLRRVKDVIDFERFRPILADAYCKDQGRPAKEPLLLLKLEFLQYQYNHSDRQVIMHACSNMAYRYFLDLSLYSSLPHHTLLTYFRQRLGTQRHQQIFDAMVGQARERGLVKDRLRLKDATHVLANIAIPTTIALVAQTRERLLQALEPWAPAEASINVSVPSRSGKGRKICQVRNACWSGWCICVSWWPGPRSFAAGLSSVSLCRCSNSN